MHQSRTRKPLKTSGWKKRGKNFLLLPKHNLVSLVHYSSEINRDQCNLKYNFKLFLPVSFTEVMYLKVEINRKRAASDGNLAFRTFPRVKHHPSQLSKTRAKRCKKKNVKNFVECNSRAISTAWVNNLGDLKDFSRSQLYVKSDFQKSE